MSARGALTLAASQGKGELSLLAERGELTLEELDESEPAAHKKS